MRELNVNEIEQVDGGCYWCRATIGVVGWLFRDSENYGAWAYNDGRFRRSIP